MCAGVRDSVSGWVFGRMKFVFGRGGTNDVVCVSCRVGGVCVREVGRCVGLCGIV